MSDSDNTLAGFKHTVLTLRLCILAAFALIISRKLVSLVPVSLVFHQASDGTIQLSIQSWVVTYNVLNIIDIASTVLLIVAFYLTFIWAWQNKQKKKGENMLEKIHDAEAS